jgi:hypothetical protein
MECTSSRWYSRDGLGRLGWWGCDALSYCSDNYQSSQRYLWVQFDPIGSRVGSCCRSCWKGCNLAPTNGRLDLTSGLRLRPLPRIVCRSESRRFRCSNSKRREFQILRPTGRCWARNAAEGPKGGRAPIPSLGGSDSNSCTGRRLSPQ